MFLQRVLVMILEEGKRSLVMSLSQVNLAWLYKNDMKHIMLG